MKKKLGIIFDQEGFRSQPLHRKLSEGNIPGIEVTHVRE